jgi:hypothetical protein
MNRKMKTTLLFSTFLTMFLLFWLPAMAADTIEVVESEAGFYYTVQEGDTLWDLSQHFNDSPWLWPELWQENDQITNPHWIFPGERIRLYKRSGDQQITASGTTAPIRSVAGQPAAPETTPAAATTEAGPFFDYPPINGVGFIRKPAVSPAGTIFEVQGRKVLISEGDIVYIRPTDSAHKATFIPGSQHTVYRYKKPTADYYRYMKPTAAPYSTKTFGTQHYILGIVEVVRNESGMTIAKVLKSYRNIRVDDMLMPFHPQSPRIKIKPSTPGIDGQIIIAEDHTYLLGDYMLAFIDKGRADDIEVGQQYKIYKKQKMALENDQIFVKSLPPVDIGTCLVLHTEATTSTVVVTNAVHAIAPGEKFRTPVN